MKNRDLVTAGAVLATLVALGCAEKALDGAAQAQGKQAPMFEVDPFWPRPLPNHWILGSTIGIGVDSRDHIYIIHRRDTFNERTEIGAATDPVKADCCIPAPNVLEFLVRVPLEAMRDVNFPESGPGYLVISEADETLRDAATIWVAQEVSSSLRIKTPT